MKVEIIKLEDSKRLAPCTLEEFADKHGLTMIVEERGPGSGRWRERHRFSAWFRGSLRSLAFDNAIGFGSTPERAIASYARLISHRKLSISCPGGSPFVSLDVPILTYGEPRQQPSVEPIWAAAWDLSIWAASIEWDPEEPNSAEWLAGLQEQIERVQALCKPLGFSSGMRVAPAVFGRLLKQVKETLA